MGLKVSSYCGEGGDVWDIHMQTGEGGVGDLGFAGWQGHGSAWGN